MSSLQSALQCVSVVQWVLTFLLMGPGFLILSIILILYTKFWWIVLLYMVWYFYDRSTPECGGRVCNWARCWALWRAMAAYFPVKLIKTCDLDEQENYLLGYHPHGVLSTGAFINFATEATGFSKLFPGIKSHLSVLKGHFDFPVYRDYFMMTGSLAVTKKSLINVLGGACGKGHLVALVVGGAPEALDAHPGQYIVHLKNKKGFIKIALQTGSSLVPCISFGETDLFEQCKNAKGSLLRRVQDFGTNVFGFSPPIFFGRFGPFLPFRRPINTIIGKPIKVEKVEQPSQEQIDELHEQYIFSFRDLFDKHKEKYSVSSTELQIV